MVSYKDMLAAANAAVLEDHPVEIKGGGSASSPIRSGLRWVCASRKMINYNERAVETARHR